MIQKNMAENPEKSEHILNFILELDLTHKNGRTSKCESVLNDNVIGFYFSASWSPPCQEFTPQLKEFHDELVDKRKLPFVIVYVPCDRSIEEMSRYMNEMHGNWWALPFDENITREMQRLYNTQLVPKLIIVKPNGEVITMKGRKEISDRGVSAFRTWFDASEIKLTTKNQTVMLDEESIETDIEPGSDDSKDIENDTKLSNEN